METSEVPVRLTCSQTDQETPDWILKAVRDLFGGRIELDPATKASNPVGARRFYTQDGLVLGWDHKTFVNPPYGEGLYDWTDKIAYEASFKFSIVALLPCGARFSVKRFQSFLGSKGLTAVCFIGKRVNFTDGPGNLYDSALYCFNVPSGRAKACLRPLGVVWSIS